MTKKKVPCEVYSRIVGYYSPRQTWNIGKLQEAKDRKPFNIGKEKWTGKEDDEKLAD